jgi:ribosomal protein S18 acetylase RimI-like enzyme
MAPGTIRILTPPQLTEPEFASVQALIADGGEVQTTHLAEYLKASHRIGLVEISGELASVGAIKAARQLHIWNLATQSRYPLDSENCMGEFGYVVTKADFRKRGLARALSTELLKDFGGALYATTRNDNFGIHKIVREMGFTNVGSGWRSAEHHDSSVLLWLKK